MFNRVIYRNPKVVQSEGSTAVWCCVGHSIRL